VQSALSRRCAAYCGNGPILECQVAILEMTGSINMLNISRWAGPGGSYRTVQRFYVTPLEWLKLNLILIKTHLFDKDDVILIAGDEVVVSKSGKSTHGIGRFFSSLVNKPISAVCFQVLSFISVKNRKSYPVYIKQMTQPAKEEKPVAAQNSPESEKEGVPADSGHDSVRPEKEKTPVSGGNPADSGSEKEESSIHEQNAAESESEKGDTPVSGENSAGAGKKTKKRRRGRPEGSRNRNRKDIELSPAMIFLKQMIDSVLQMTGTDINLIYFVYDGALGNNTGVQAVRRSGLHIISKLRYDSALYFPYDGPYSGRGRPKKYGKKIDYKNIPSGFLKKTLIEDNIRTEYYGMTMLHKIFADKLNVLVIIKTDIITNKKRRIILFTTDLELSWEKIEEYYPLRFQIEFNFRDAKQFWGLEDFMNITAQSVINAASLSMFMVNISYILRNMPDFFGMSIIDLKIQFHAVKYVREILKFLPEHQDPVFIRRIMEQISAIGRINMPEKADTG
jgi:putative transposase